MRRVEPQEWYDAFRKSKNPQMSLQTEFLETWCRSWLVPLQGQFGGDAGAFESGLWVCASVGGCEFLAMEGYRCSRGDHDLLQVTR